MPYCMYEMTLVSMWEKPHWPMFFFLYEIPTMAAIVLGVRAFLLFFYGLKLSGGGGAGAVGKEQVRNQSA